jgi:hypothetical protein
MNRYLLARPRAREDHVRHPLPTPDSKTSSSGFNKDCKPRPLRRVGVPAGRRDVDASYSSSASSGPSALETPEGSP